MKIHYLGPAASFTHEAGLTIFNKHDLAPESSIEEVLEQVKNDPTALGIVPVENTLEGIVIRTLDFILAKKLRVIIEINLPIKQNLLSAEKTLAAVQTVYSHPHALAQTSIWLKKHLALAKIQETSSTSQAALIASQNQGTAAIGSLEAAKDYKLNVLAKNISNFKLNLTRFWVVSSGQTTPLPWPTSLATKTSIYLVIQDQVGALRNLLDSFAANHISLTSIQSRPLPDQPWKYGFFLDLLVDAADPLADQLFKNLKKIHPRVDVLGTYPQLGPINRQAIITYNLKRIHNIFKPNEVLGVKKFIKQASQQLTAAAIPPAVQKIWAARLLIGPSVALYKYRHHLPIHDEKREQLILNKFNQLPTIKRSYQKLMQLSKELQTEAREQLIPDKASSQKIVNLPLPALRYYIDYLDTLSVTFLINDKICNSNN